MPIQLRWCLGGFLLSAFAALSIPVNAQPAGDVNDKFLAEVAAARESLQEQPKFQKYYEDLNANPDSLPVNGPKLAVLLAAVCSVAEHYAPFPLAIAGRNRPVLRIFPSSPAPRLSPQPNRRRQFSPAVLIYLVIGKFCRQLLPRNRRMEDDQWATHFAFCIRATSTCSSR